MMLTYLTMIWCHMKSVSNSIVSQSCCCHYFKVESIGNSPVKKRLKMEILHEEFSFNKPVSIISVL